jgi:hypothetical protein
MIDASHIQIGSKPDPYPLDVMGRACQLLWPDNGIKKLSSRDISFILKKEFGRRAYFICDLLYPPEK